MERPMQMDSNSSRELLLVQEVKVEFDTDFSEEISTKNSLLEIEAIPSQVKLKTENISDNEMSEMKQFEDEWAYFKTVNQSDDNVDNQIEIEIKREIVQDDEIKSHFNHDEIMRTTWNSRMEETKEGHAAKSKPWLTPQLSTNIITNKQIEEGAVEITHEGDIINTDPDTLTKLIPERGFSQSASFKEIFDREWRAKKRLQNYTQDKCNICEKIFASKRNLRRHMLTHTGEKPHECNMCKRRFSRKTHLGRHMLTHTGEKPHECLVCKKTFNQQGNLRKHMLMHTGEKPYECDTCKRRFSRKNAIRQHVVTHTGDKPHECDVCKKSFHRNDCLRKHMMMHTGEKPYECDRCQKKFSRRYVLRQHLIIHRREVS